MASNACKRDVSGDVSVAQVVFRALNSASVAEAGLYELHRFVHAVAAAAYYTVIVVTVPLSVLVVSLPRSQNTSSAGEASCLGTEVLQAVA